MYEDNDEDWFTDDVSDMLANCTPVILVGRGGSGTRLLSQLVFSTGVFLGNELNVSFDSEEWIEDIYNLAIRTMSTTGIESESDEERYWIRRLRKRAATILRNAGRRPEDCWGWKLPETILILPLVLKAFPNAYVIHFVRHPLTSSWRRTHMTSRLDNPIGRAVLPAAYQAYGFELEKIECDEPYFHNLITWTYQVQQAYEILGNRARPDRILHLRYEDICDNPADVQDRVVDFLGLTPPKIDCAIKINPERINELPDYDPNIEKAWLICGEVASRFGYEYGLKPVQIKHNI